MVGPNPHGMQQPNQQSMLQARINADLAKREFMKLQENADFAKLSLVEQREVRGILADKFLPFEQEFLGMNQGEQQQVFQTLIEAPPVFENMEFGQNVVEMVGRAQQGDQKAQETIDAELFADRMRRSSLLFSLVDQHVFGDAVHEAREATGTGEFLPDMRAMRDPDVQKANQYMRIARSELDSWSQHAETWEAIAGTAANIAEFMALWKVGAGPIKAPVGVGKIFTKGFQEAASRAAIGGFKRFGLDVAGSAAHAFATTGIGFAREKSIELSNDTFAQYAGFREMMAENMHVFGRYVAFDILTNMLFDIALPHARGIAQSFKNKRNSMDVLLQEKLSQYDWKNIGDFLWTDTVNPAIIKQYPMELQEILMAKHSMFRTLKNVSEASREDLLKLAAGTMNIVVDNTASGAFRARNAAGMKPMGTFKDLDSLEQFIVREQLSTATFPMNAADKAVRGAAGHGAFVRSQLRQTLPNAPVDNVDNLANLLAPKGGTFDAKSIHGVTRELLRQTGAPDDLIAKTVVKETADAFTVTIPGQPPVTFAKTVANASQEFEPIRALLQRIELTATARPAASGLAEQTTQMQAARRTLESTGTAVTEPPAGAKWMMANNSGEVRYFRTREEARAFADHQDVVFKRLGNVYEVKDRATGQGNFFLGRIEDMKQEGFGAVEASAAPAVRQASALGDQAGLERLKALADGGYQESLARQHLFTPGWVEHVARDRFGGTVNHLPNGKLEFFARGRKTAEVFDNYEDFGRWLISKSGDKDYLAAYLKQHEGIVMTLNKQGTGYTLHRGGRVLAEDISAEDIFKRFPELSNHAPASLGPELAFTDLRGTVQARWTGGAYENSYQGVLKHLDHFKKPKPLDYVLGSAEDGKITLGGKGASQVVEIEIPGVGYRESFNSVAEAKKWMAGGWQDWDRITRIGYMKGYRVETAGTGFALYTDTGSPLFVRNKEELYKAFQTAPIPEWAPELSGLSEELASALPKGALRQTAGPVDFASLGPVTPEKATGMLANLQSFERHASNLLRPPHGWLDSMVKEGGDPAMARLFREGEDVLRLVTGQEYKTMAMAKKALTDTKTGKIVTKERSQHLYDYITQADPAKKAEIAKASGFTAEDFRIAKDVRAWFDAMGESFGLNGQRYLENYLPRMVDRWKNLTADAKNKVVQDPKTFWETVMGEKPPKDLAVFFQNPRTSDIARFLEQKDLFTLMHKYQSVGHRKMFFQSWVDKFEAMESGLSKTTMNEATSHMYERLKQYRADLVGMAPDPGTQDLSRAWKTFLTKRGVSKLDIEALDDSFLQMGYFASMGYRPWLPIRNTFQIFTTLDPWLGENWVPGAIKKVVGDVDGKIYRELMESGVIPSDLPLSGMDIADMNSFVGRFLKRGMKWYQNSDHYTRAVAYTAATDKFDAAWKQLSDGVIDRAEFVSQSSGIHAVREGRQGDILKLIDRGDVRAARHLVGMDLTEHTMFAYRHTAKPELFRKGLVGKLFGMFGTYPVQYVENVRQAMGSSMTAAQKAAWATKFLANGSALYLGFRELAGIEAQNFLPWVPAQFAGGPWYDLGYGMSKALSPGYRGRQARAEVFGLKSQGGQIVWKPHEAEVLKWMVPFNFAIRGGMRAVDYANQGKGYQAFLSLGAFPIRPDLW